MKQSKQTILITLILAIFILVTGVYFSSLISEFKTSKADSQNQFSYIVRTVSDSMQNYSNDKNKFVNSILECIENTNTVSAITVKSEKSLLFSFPADVSKATSIPFSITKSTVIYDKANKFLKC